jgi:hypothetical protein
MITYNYDSKTKKNIFIYIHEHYGTEIKILYEDYNGENIKTIIETNIKEKIMEENEDVREDYKNEIKQNNVLTLGCNIAYYYILVPQYICQYVTNLINNL